MILNIMVESKTPGLLVAKLLQAEQQAGRVKILSYSEPSSMTGSAKGFLAVRREPVAVVQNAESTYPRAAAWMRQGIEEVMGDTIWRRTVPDPDRRAGSGGAPVPEARRHRGRTGRSPNTCWKSA